MKAGRLFKKLTKINAALVILGLILGLSSFSPTVSAKTRYNTLAYDKKLSSESDFETGEFKNTRIKKTAEGVEIVSLDGEAGEYITPIIEAPFGATHVGLHWKGDTVDDPSITAYVRTSDDGKNFSEWVETTAEMDEGRNGRRDEEIFSALVGTENTRFSQARIKFPAEDGRNARLNQFTFTFLNSGEESAEKDKKLSLVSNTLAEGTAVEKTSPGGQKVSVISREEWGANEDYRLDRKGNEEWPRSYHGTRKIVVHHTAGISSNGETDLAINMETVRSIYYYHAVTQKWGDIGYNALVDAAGNVYEGRYGTHGTSITRTNPAPEDIMVLDTEAGHAASYNSGSFGVSAMGDFTDFEVPAAQLTGLESVLAYVADSRGINVQGNSDFLRYDGTWDYDLNNVVGHRDVTATACPGEKLYALMQSIKNYVDDLLPTNPSGFDAVINGTDISGTSIGLGTINFSWSTFYDAAGQQAANYQYFLERVYGTVGVASDSEPWETSWFNPENINAKTIPGTSVSIESGDLQADSQYVFYVRALDAAGNPISTAKHVNFKRDSSVGEDAISPIASIDNPADGAIVSGIVAIKATAADNVGIALMELYIDGKKVATSAIGTLNYNWNTKKAASGIHTLLVKAYDAAGNVGIDTATVTK